MAIEDQGTDEQIQQWADEAGAGYDVGELKRRGRGRPGRGAEPAQVIAVRLSAEEIEALDAYAATPAGGSSLEMARGVPRNTHLPPGRALDQGHGMLRRSLV